jgi:hypothetical protein
MSLHQFNNVKEPEKPTPRQPYPFQVGRCASLSVTAAMPVKAAAAVR